jgi:hypothetical protein
VIEVQSPDYHSALDDAKRVEGIVMEAAACLYATIFCSRAAEQKGKAKN